MTRDELILLNSNFCDRNPKDVEDLLIALSEASFEWSQQDEAFVNKKLGKLIKVSGLHVFDARSIREDWGNKDFVEEQDRLKILTKIGCTGILLIPIAVLIAIVWDWRIGGGLVLVGVLSLVISDSRKKKLLEKREQREGRWVDRSKIEWCKNCVHFRKIRKWEDSFDGLWKLPEAPDADSLPCQIVAQTADLWEGYFNLPHEKRAMYPKECPKFQMRSNRGTIRRQRET
jgi:hypothetical protein